MCDERCDIKSATNAVVWLTESEGYRFGAAIDDDADQWMMTAKRDFDGRFLRVRCPTEERTIMMLAEAAGVKLEDA